MRQRQNRGFRPTLESLECKLLLSAGLSPISGSKLGEGSRAWALHQADHPETLRIGSETGGLRARPDQARRGSSPPGFTIFRITNTAYPLTVHLTPPFQQVLVQSRAPTPGQVYNVLSLAMRNGTERTFDASSGFAVRLSSTGAGTRRWYPILAGAQQWKPGQFIVVYVLSKKYYPVQPVVSGGFTFNFAPGRVAIPGPSGIFLRLPYRPAAFAKTLDWIVAHGPGVQGGKGAKWGLPDTAIWEFVSLRSAARPP